jgi:hypothetical protein
MSKYNIIITLAIWIIILPFLGFPGFWRTLLLVLSGFGIIVLTLLIKSESSSRENFRFGGNGDDAYVDNGHEKKEEK